MFSFEMDNPNLGSTPHEMHILYKLNISCIMAHQEVRAPKFGFRLGTRRICVFFQDSLRNAARGFER